MLLATSFLLHKLSIFQSGSKYNNNNNGLFVLAAKSWINTIYNKIREKPNKNTSITNLAN